MARTAEEARQELVEALERSFGIDYVPQGELGAGGLRRSSVLILFGALDRVPADARIPRSVPAELDVLLTRRSPRMRAHAGQIAFPGGGAEPGDADTTETALREAAEETGLNPSGVEVLGALPELHLQVSNNLVTPVIGWWRLPSEVAADHSESVEVMRVPVAEMVDPAARGMSVRRSKEVVYRSAAFELGPQFGGHIVWGFTGMLLSSIYDAAGWAEPWDRTREFEV